MPPRGKTETFANALPETRRATEFYNEMFGSPRGLPIVFGVADMDLDMPVLEIVFHAIKLRGTVDTAARRRQLLHWRLSAVTNIEPSGETGNYDGRCIATEMTSTGGARSTALTVFKSTPHPWTDGAVTYRRLAMGPRGVGITAKALIELLLKDWEVYRFELVNKVSGCLHWSTTVLQKLCEVGIIQQDSIALCKEIVVRARQSDVAWVPEDVRGRFLNPVLQDFPLVV